MRFDPKPVRRHARAAATAFGPLLLAALLLNLLILPLTWLLRAQGAEPAIVRPGWLGVVLEEVKQEEAATLGWSAPRGARIASLAEGSPPAAQAGLQPGGVVLPIDGGGVGNLPPFLTRLRSGAARASVHLKVIRNRVEMLVAAVLVELPLPPRLLMFDTGGHMASVIATAT